MEVTLYTTHCPKCRVLEAKLKQKGVKFEVVEDQDVMVEKGFMEAPMLEVDGKIMDFVEAVIWLNNKDRSSTEDTGECPTCKL